MKSAIRRISYCVVSIIMIGCISVGSVFAEPVNNNSNNAGSTQAQANVLTGCAAESSSNNGAGVLCILKTVRDIMTAGVGILAVLGIVLVGFQYITSSGNEAKMVVAKKRIFEIAVGLLIYAILYAITELLGISS